VRGISLSTTKEEIEKGEKSPSGGGGGALELCLQHSENRQVVKIGRHRLIIARNKQKRRTVGKKGIT